MEDYDGTLFLDRANSQAWLQSQAVPNGIILIVDLAGDDSAAYDTLRAKFGNGQPIRVTGRIATNGGTQPVLFMQGAVARP